VIAALIHVLKERQSEIRLSLALGNAKDFNAYQTLVGEYRGLQYALDKLDEQLAEKE
jgi:hypothetical protein